MQTVKRSELIWAMYMSGEDVCRQLLEKGYIDNNDLAEIREGLRKNIDEYFSAAKFHVLPGQQRTIDRFLRPMQQYLSLTETARKFDPNRPGYLIQSWLRSRNTIEFLATWERKNNQDFSESAYEHILQLTASPSYTLTPKKWIETTNAIGMVSKQGKGGGTMAHLYIACDFEMWVDMEFRYTLVENFMNSKVFIGE